MSLWSLPVLVMDVVLPGAMGMEDKHSSRYFFTLGVISQFNALRFLYDWMIEINIKIWLKLRNEMLILRIETLHVCFCQGVDFLIFHHVNPCKSMAETWPGGHGNSRTNTSSLPSWSTVVISFPKMRTHDVKPTTLR